MEKGIEKSLKPKHGNKVKEIKSQIETWKYSHNPQWK